ncbi:MAG: hypothetical protein ACE5QF_00165 [Thermoplasmata archaeon]
MDPNGAKFALLTMSVIVPLLLIMLGVIFDFGGILLVLGALIWMGSSLIVFLPFLEEEKSL